MACCTIIALVIGATIWLFRQLSFTVLGHCSKPLLWTLEIVPSDLPTEEAFSWRNRLESFSHAVRGLKVVCRHEHNMWIHIGVTLAVVASGIALKIDPIAWRWVMLCIGLVFFAEVLNTAIEALCDALHPQRDPAIGLAKDIAAGAVLICALTALLIGILTFAPYLWQNQIAADLCGL